MSQRSWFVLMAVLLIVLLGAAIGAPLHQGKEKAPETAVEEDQTGGRNTGTGIVDAGQK